MTQATLHTLLEHEESGRDLALAAAQRARAAADAAQAQAEQLVAYRGDYRRRWSERFAGAGAIEIVRCYQDFTARLDQAIGQQQRIVERAAAEAEAARQALAAAEMRVAAVRKLIERRLHDERSRAARLDQKQTDEAAQRASWVARAVSAT